MVRGSVSSCVLALVWALGVAPAGAAVAATPIFVTGPLPQAVGVTYGPSAGGRNEDAEPGIGVAGDGTIWIGSNIDVNTAGDPRAMTAIAGEDIWKSSDGGKTFQWVAAPFNPSSSSPGLGGEDSDLTVAPEKNSNGFYNVYATSLYVAASNMAFSQDGGASWTVVSLGGIPAQDRPWLSADGPCTFYLTYHQLPLFSPVVNKYDVCNLANVGMGFALNPVQSTSIFAQNTLPGATNGFNKPAVDNSPTSTHRHNIYVPMEACNLQNPADYLSNLVNTAELIPICPQGVNTYVEVAVSTDGGTTFNDYVVAPNSNGEQQVWPTSVAVDAAGVVYVAWSDNHHSFVSKSIDQGQTWSQPKLLDAAPVLTSVYPTIAAGAPGVVEVAYYGSSTSGDSNDMAKMGTPGKPAAAPWRLYWAKSTDGGGSFLTSPVSGVIHTGELCTKGSGCTDAGARNLYDDFGLVISPATGRAAIAFSSDQLMLAQPGAAVDPFTAFASEAGPATAVPGATPTPPRVTPSTSAGAPAWPLAMLLAAALCLLVPVLRLARRR